MGHDAGKDQSYVLFGAPIDQLDRMRLPVGDFTKDEIREKAKELGLPVHSKPDSQEICFVPDNDYAGLVERSTPDAVEEGDIVDLDGKVLGTHPGHQHYTIGQRRGIGVALGHPLYVIDKNADTNRITVGTKESLLATGCMARETNWHEEATTSFRSCTAKIRYNADPVPARVRATAEGELEVRFDDPQESVAPGQAVVCYEEDMVLCGGWIHQPLDD
jgi:tRNA-specific 2-thiouridylase